MADPFSAAIAAMSSMIGTGAAAGTAAAGGTSMLGSLAGGASLISGGMSALSQYRQGQATQVQMDQAATQEKIRAQDEAIARRERLLDALSMQSARTGAAGITTVGTPTQIQDADIENYEFEQRSADVSSKAQQKTLKAKGSSAVTSGKIGAGISLLSTGVDYGKVG